MDAPVTKVTPAALFRDAPRGDDDMVSSLREVAFGEYLVEHNVISRYQLFRALQLQDRLPKVRLGEAAAALGYAHPAEISALHKEFVKLQAVTV